MTFAACGNPCSPITKVGSKRNWKIANEESVTHGTASPSAADKDTPRHSLNLRDHENAGGFSNLWQVCCCCTVLCIRDVSSVPQGFLQFKIIRLREVSGTHWLRTMIN